MAMPITGSSPKRREGAMAAELKLVRTAAEQGLVERFPAVKSSIPGGAQIVIKLRDAAFDVLAKRGLPNRRVEEWKYTDLRGLMREAAPLADKPGPADIAAAFNSGTALPDVNALRLTFVNGHLAAEISDLGALPDGLEITPLGEALASGHPLLKHISPVEGARENVAYALNAAFMTDGAVIRVVAGTALDTPVHLRHLNQGAAPFATATRVLLVVEEGASLTVLETH